ncbi:UNVERIFIED_CONTAM: Cyclin-T1-4 [Sesamum calycinum]|uniref:Cyclin-T1-4 n=1 Tax=Sesamum calycinum TaxID=2727403 RepID=A0AAW2IZ67_9LAMI
MDQIMIMFGPMLSLLQKGESSQICPVKALGDPINAKPNTKVVLRIMLTCCNVYLPSLSTLTTMPLSPATRVQLLLLQPRLMTPVLMPQLPPNGIAQSLKAEEVIFMSRDEIERCSPSRKDGIDVLHETHLRYSYCAFLQNLGVQLDLPQTTVGTAMVLCHRFFVRRSHASHDRFLIATAALFLASKSEETPRPLNDVLRASCEMLHKQDFDVLSYMLPIDWFDQYREQIIGAEQLILTTLNFELGVQHPYESLTSTLQKLGFSQSVLVNLALSLVSEGLFHMECYKQAEEFVKALAGLKSSLWLQFKPHQIAAGAAYLAAKILNMNLDSCHKVWHEFHTPPSVLRVHRNFSVKPIPLQLRIDYMLPYTVELARNFSVFMDLMTVKGLDSVGIGSTARQETRCELLKNQVIGNFPLVHLVP